MLRFIASRAFECLIVLLVMSFVIYGLIGLMPGDPIDEMITANPNFSSSDIARLKSLHGLDKPLLDRYGNWLTAAFTGNFGFSRIYSRPAIEVLIPHLINTLILMSTAIALSLAIALPLGIIAAIKPRSAFDHVVNLFSFFSISMPPFWLALLAILIFSVKLQWLPASGMSATDADSIGMVRYMILPVSVLTLLTAGGYIRFIRASMIQVLRQDFIRTARAKGASTPQLLIKHALRNAALPFITVLALSFGSLFSGALITETMFSWLGLGKMIFDAVLGNDFNLALIGLLLATLMTLICNVLADVAYACVDPRITNTRRGYNR
ncbi:MAG: diguanylate cyclase [Magnetovibrio sp.]|nr:diguanylate cyclase [Magnetovibrio sp.]